MCIRDRRKVPIDGFNRQSLNAKLAIAVTANFVNYRTKEETSVEEISGISKQFNMKFFADIEKDKGISLENIVYYKGDTHYFVMTALRNSLLSRGVLTQNFVNDRKSLMLGTNINWSELQAYAVDVAEYSTKYLSNQIPTTEFALDPSGKPDVADFVFSFMYSA